MEEKNHHYLQKAIEELPQWEPQGHLWHKIEAQLGFEDTLAKALPSLPELEPEEGSWQRLESRLPVKIKAPEQVISLRLFTYLSAAACVILIIAAALFFRPTDSDTLTLSYSQELYFEEPQMDVPEGHLEIQEAMGFIKTSCEKQVQACQTLHFQQLKGQLEELQKQMQVLKEQQSVYGKEPELIKAQIKLENLQAQITKELIQLIIA